MIDQERINQEFRETLNDHSKHLQVANNEMGTLKNDTSVLKNDVGWLKSEFYTFVKTLNKLDARTWMILSTTVLGVLGLIVQITIAIYKK